MDIHVPVARRQRSRRARFLTWLRKTHLYVGLWGAVFGLLLGVTGIVLNHRAVLPIQIEKFQKQTVMMHLPDGGFHHPADMVDWLRKQTGFDAQAPSRVTVQQAMSVPWETAQIFQPERWSIQLSRPHQVVSAEYWQGNGLIRVERTDSTWMGVLVRLHMAVGVDTFWVLLSDTIAASFVVLSITGLLLWTQLHTVRLLGVATALGATIAALMAAFQMSLFG